MLIRPTGNDRPDFLHSLDPLPSLGDVGAGGSFMSPSSHSNDSQPTAALMENPYRAAVNDLLDVVSSAIASGLRSVMVLRPAWGPTAIR